VSAHTPHTHILGCPACIQAAVKDHGMTIGYAGLYRWQYALTGDDAGRYQVRHDRAIARAQKVAA
jgi:hypothetical protein